METGVKMEKILQVKAVHQVFTSPTKNSVEALRNISFEVSSGEFVSIVGASGSGKSTLLRIIDGLIKATSGDVLVGNHKVEGPGRDRAMVFQHDSLMPWRNVIQNISYGLILSGMNKKEAEEAASYYLNLVELNGFEHHFPHQLSGGMRQRVNVARALAVKPSILLMDEPFAALDSQTREIMQSELLSIWEKSKNTVLLITHQIDEAVFLSDRVIIFSARPGQIREEIVIDLPRPRGIEIKRTQAFVHLVDRIWKLIEHEVRASLKETQS